MNQTLIDIASSPILFKLAALVAVPIVVTEWGKLGAKVVGFFTAKGDANEADAAALAELAGEGMLNAIKGGADPADAFAKAKASAIAFWAANHNRAVKDAEGIVGDVIHQRLHLKANLPAPAPMAGKASQVNFPDPAAPTHGVVDLGMLVGLCSLGLLVALALVFRWRDWKREKARRRTRVLPKFYAVALLLVAAAAPARAQTTSAPGTTTVTVVAPPIDWKTVTFNHGPSIPLIEIEPRNIHPLQLAAGAGYSAGACFGQLTLSGTATSVVCASAVGFADVISPSGTPEGGVQVAFIAGFLGNALAVGPLFTPWTADGNGFLQAGRPGTDWVFQVNPVSIWHLLVGS